MFCLTEIINFGVNLQPRFVFRWREVRHQLHQIRHHLFANASHERRALGSNADHYFSAILRPACARDIAEIFETRHQTTRCRRGMSHLLRNRRHREHFLLIKRSQEKILREGDVARSEFLAEMHEKTTLHFQNNVGKPFRISPKLCRIGFGQRRFQFHRAKAKRRVEGVNGAKYILIDKQDIDFVASAEFFFRLHSQQRVGTGESK
jgi:hypothetical protein